jgi:YesN/AraC family two-component response regulator
MHSHHHHNEFEIYYMVSGKCSYFIEDKSYEVQTGDVVLIPENIIHRTKYSQETHLRILIECSGDFVPRETREALSELYYVYRNPNLAPEIHASLKRIEKEYKNPDSYSKNIIEAEIKLLIYSIVRNKNTRKETSDKDSLIDKVVSYVKENFSQDITLSSVAKAHFVSQEHLSRTFKKETGFGFNEYLTIVRLRYAEERLKKRDAESISKIAYDAGFNDSNYFSDKFKRAYGVSPLKYSKEN